MFNDIVIRRFDSNNKTIQTIPVPISYGRRSKMIALLERDPTTIKTQIQIPRIAFNIINITYAEDRRTSPLNKNRKVFNQQYMATQFAEIPYNIEFELDIYAKTYDDATQIVEQIIPYFQPSFIPTVKLIPELDLEYDLKTTLIGMSINDDFEGSPDEQGMVIWQMNFTMNSYFFGPVSQQGVIKRVQVDLIPVPGSDAITDEDVITYGRQERIVVIPGLTADGQPTSNTSLTIPYSEINPDDPYAFITELYDFDDGKKFNPTDLKDE